MKWRSLNQSLILSSALLTSPTLSAPVYAEVMFSDIQPGIVEQNDRNRRQFQTTVPAEIMIITPEKAVTQLEVLPPVWVSGPTADPQGTQATATVEFNGVSIDSASTDPAPLPVGNTRLDIFMQVQRPAQFPVGQYTYQVQILTTTNPL